MTAPVARRGDPYVRLYANAVNMKATQADVTLDFGLLEEFAPGSPVMTVLGSIHMALPNVVALHDSLGQLLAQLQRQDGTS
jgi:hypothetical protein